MSEERVYGVFHAFCGIGGGALGFQQSTAEWRGLRGRYRTLGGIDVDPAACADFEALTGVAATCRDLFTREGYAAFHGCEPPADWREATWADLRAAAGGHRPDVVFGSPPCKGLSALLPKAQSDSARYQALNALVARWVHLTMDAWGDDPPGLLILENVARITSRGAALLREVKSLLKSHGYEVQDGLHDVGEVGGLGQHRRRYLLVARHAEKVPDFLYQPPKRRVRAIGEILGPLPMPDDPAAGPMHRLPRLNWLTWVRLALIPAGGDWRDLQGVEPGSYRIEPARCPHFNHVARVTPWDEPAGAVAGGAGPSQGAISVADPRVSGDYFQHLYRVTRWDEAAGTVTGATRPAGGAVSVADPRLGHEPRKGVFGITAWDDPSGAVTSAMRAGGSNVAASVADPRLGCSCRSGAYGVLSWDDPAGAVTGAGDVHAQGAAAVADPRLPEDTESGALVIVAEDGTWHRPLTTLELAAIQGLPTTMPDGRPLTLAGKSQARSREAIGNAVPPPAAKAIGDLMLLALLPANSRTHAKRTPFGAGAILGTAIWVRRVVALALRAPRPLPTDAPEEAGA